MAYNVLDVCRYVINYSNDKDYGISNLKLQKILYFIQAYFLISANKKCFEEKIEAWDLDQWFLRHTENISNLEAGIYQL